MSRSAPDSTIQKVLDDIAADNGMAVVLVDRRSRAVAASNNNSICRLLLRSEEFAPKCAEFCGRAFDMAAEAGKSVPYECHAGLECRAVPLKKGKTELVAIVGRAFTRSSAYRNATSRAMTGDWRHFPPTKFFDNVLLIGSVQSLDRAAGEVEAIERDELADLEEKQSREPQAKVEVKEIVPETQRPANVPAPVATANTVDEVTVQSVEKARAEPDGTAFETAEIKAWRAFFGSILEPGYKKACDRVLEFLGRQYDLGSMIWLARNGNRLEPVSTYGEMKEKLVRIGIGADDPRLKLASREEMPLILKERPRLGASKNRKAIGLFPIVVGGEIRGALAISKADLSSRRKRRVVKFCRMVAPQLEILRLREEVSRRDVLADAVRRFNEGIKNLDSEDFWQKLIVITAELMQAERASLLVPSDFADALLAKASIGAHVDLSFDTEVGSRIARKVLERGKPVLVSDVRRIPLPPAPEDRRYRTGSFISFPIAMGDRNIALLNFADKVGGDVFDQDDMEMLSTIAPQIAVAIDRTSLRDKAGQYAQLSVTDPLTGLLNRRYIEERLTEEIKRSNRTGEPVSFLMLDVDEFKSYNDHFGHPAGDEALLIVGQILKDTLRGADVAARYGGEEFAVLLPQTTADEAATIAERIRQRVEATEFPKRRVTVSIGIASLSRVISSVRDLIGAADKALYRAKRSGRNNVRIYGGQGSEAAENFH
jgi:diguanylate cyclase (GGDEF)-like protein